MQHPDFKGHKVFCDCNASWAKDIRGRGLELERDYDFPGRGDCPDCNLNPWYYLNDQKPGSDSLNETAALEGAVHKCESTFEGHKLYCNCNASWNRDINIPRLVVGSDFKRLNSPCPNCGTYPWYYINGQRPSPNSLNETVEANAKSLGAKESVGTTWPKAKASPSPFLTSLTLAQRRQLYANLIAFKTFASKVFGGVAVRCSVVVRSRPEAKTRMVGFRIYRNGVPTELPHTIFKYASDIQCYPFLEHTTTEGQMGWC